MFWGCITSEGPGPLVPIQGTMTAVKYREILERHILPIANSFGEEEWWYQHDNAPCHSAVIVREFLEGHHVNVLDWPP